MELFFLILELAGTLAFAASGAITGLKRGMDLFGVCTLGLTTAVGGGVIRDVILGNTPPATFQDPIYALVALGASLVLFLPGIRRVLMWDQRLYDLSMLIHAGIGVAMGTASDTVKTQADYVTGTVDEDGILSALGHFQLI